MPTESRLGPRAEVVRGTLEMLTLKLLGEESMHGWGLSLKLREISREARENTECKKAARGRLPCL